MSVFSEYYLVLLVFLPFVYWLLAAARYRKTVLGLFSIAIVAFFYPFSAGLMMVVALAVFLILKTVSGKARLLAVLVPVIFFVLFRCSRLFFAEINHGIFLTVGIAFFSLKIIHFSLDTVNGQILEFNLPDFIFYLFFFPLFTAGPVIRYEEFTANLRSQDKPDQDRIFRGLVRITLGFLKKIVLLIPFFLKNEAAIRQGLVTGTGSMWIALLVYSFYIYWDFSSYTDIAVGSALLFNYKVPENFNQPYLKRNIALFWQNWHMTLTRWLQSYIFVPLSRLFITKMDPRFVILGNGLAQVLTMVVCGFWHGLALNFLVWGLYHGIGLFTHTLFRNATRSAKKFAVLKPAKDYSPVALAYTAVTFLFVTAGWAFFSAPLDIAFRNFSLLFGVK
jgi:alginate O-acetyltransferase complex protein AlgI